MDINHQDPSAVPSDVCTLSIPAQNCRKILKNCNRCLLFSKQPSHYCALLPKQCEFNFDVARDVMFICGQPILHTVCLQTDFSRSAPLTKKDSYKIWEAFVTIWMTPYLEVSYIVWFEQAKLFFSVQFKTLATSPSYRLLPVAVESRWSLIPELYQDPMPCISNKLAVDHCNAQLHLNFDYANLSMPLIVGPNASSPAILLFSSQTWLLTGE